MPVSNKLAVMSYLDEMLHEATIAAETEEDTVTATVSAEVIVDEVVEIAEPEIVVEPEPEPEPEPEIVIAPEEPEVIAEEVVEPTVEEPAVETEVYVASEELEEIEVEVEIEVAPEPEPENAPPVWQDNGRPAWAQHRFECLVFTVNGLKLAVPLLLLGNIHQLDRELTPLFDQPKWFLGLLPVQQDRNIRVVDTAKLVMPERYDPETAEELKYAVGVHNTDWAFGANSIEGSISLEPDAVKWRSVRTSRPWLAGTVIAEMCALVDLDAFNRILVA